MFTDTTGPLKGQVFAASGSAPRITVNGSVTDAAQLVVQGGIAQVTIDGDVTDAVVCVAGDYCTLSVTGSVRNSLVLALTDLVTVRIGGDLVDATTSLPSADVRVEGTVRGRLEVPTSDLAGVLESRATPMDFVGDASERIYRRTRAELDALRN